jgi:hypothetical protein
MSTNRQSEISNPEICDCPLAIGFRPRRHLHREPPTQCHRPAFRGTADDSPSPGGEGRGEGGRILSPFTFLLAFSLYNLAFPPEGRGEGGLYLFPQGLNFTPSEISNPEICNLLSAVACRPPAVLPLSRIPTGFHPPAQGWRPAPTLGPHPQTHPQPQRSRRTRVITAHSS